MICVDTNLLVYAHRAAVPEHRAARRDNECASVDRRGWGIALPSLVEFWSVVTHSSSSGGASSAIQARAFVDALVGDGGAAVWVPSVGFWLRLAQLASALDVQGPRVFDLQIALAAFEGGATEIWTHDQRFVSIPGMRVHDPL